MFFVQPALALVRTRRFSFFEFYYVFSLYLLFLCFFLTANVFILFKYTLFFRNMGSLFSSSVARSTDYTFNAASDGSAQVGKGSQTSVQGLGNSASQCVFSLFFVPMLFLTANVFILFKYTLFFRNMGSLFSSSVARSTDYTFNAASDGSA